MQLSRKYTKKNLLCPNTLKPYHMKAYICIYRLIQTLYTCITGTILVFMFIIYIKCPNIDSCPSPFPSLTVGYRYPSLHLLLKPLLSSAAALGSRALCYFHTPIPLLVKSFSPFSYPFPPRKECFYTLLPIFLNISFQVLKLHCEAEQPRQRSAETWYLCCH